MSSPSTAWPRATQTPRGSKLVFAVVALGVAVLAWLGAGRVLGTQVDVVAVTRADFDERLVATGAVRSPSRVELGVLTSGIAAEVTRREGQRVLPGELLLRLSDRQLLAQLEEAKAAVDEAKARLQLLTRVGSKVAYAALRKADADLRRAEQEHERTARLVTLGSVPRVELEDAERSLEAARTAKDSAGAQLASIEQKGPDLLVAMAAVRRAEARYELVLAQLSDSRIVAPSAGVLAARNVEVGDVVRPAEPLFVLLPDGPREIVIYPDEQNLRSLRLKQRAKVSADAFSDQTFNAEVSYIAPAVDPERGSVEVRLAAPSAPEYLRPDMTVSVELELGRKARALAIPYDAVRDATGPRPSAFVVHEGRVARRSIELGLRAESRVEVTRGLREGEQVIVSAPDLRDGQRVRARKFEP